MIFDFLIILELLFIPQLFCHNILFISIGQAGHVTPLFELAKELKDHHITFLTEPLAQSYINIDSSVNTSSFHIIYTNDSIDAFIAAKEKEQELIAYSANHSFFDSLTYVTELSSKNFNSLLNKTIHILMTNQFDVIIANSLITGIHILSKDANTSCIIQTTELYPSIFDFNVPNIYSLLSQKQMTQIKYRIYNVIYNLRFLLMIITKFLPLFNTIISSLPRIPGPFYESFSIKNLLSTESKCLELINISPTFSTPTYTSHIKKYLGAFIDETTIKYDENELTKWIQLKPNESIIYGAFGTSSLIQYDRMKNLINGLAEFLLRIPNCFLLLTFRGSNFETYQLVLNKMKNDKYLHILMDNQRVRIENKFLNQKWILKQNSIKLFLSHCGMGSSSEGIFFEKPILCMPFGMDQFFNSILIKQLSIGLSLFTPPSLFQSLIDPYNFYNYKFSSNNVTMKLLKLWENDKYKQMIKIMSLEMKYAGGLKQAVKEVEFFINLNGNLDRYKPFQSTLSFYQRYVLDLIIIFIILPLVIIIYSFIKCCKRHRKEKND